MSDNVISFNAHHIDRETETLHEQNKKTLKEILAIFFGLRVEDKEGIAATNLAHDIVEQAEIDAVIESYGDFAKAFAGAINRLVKSEISVPESFVPFHNDPPRFILWSLTCTVMGVDSDKVFAAITHMNDDKINKLLESQRGLYSVFLNYPGNYENAIPINKAPEVDGFEAEVLVKDGVVRGRYECGHTWGWTDDRGTQIHPTHYFKKGRE